MGGFFGGIIAGAMQGLGEGVSQLADQSIKMRDEQTLMQQRADLEVQKQKAIAIAAEELKNAPLKRLSDSAQSIMNDDIPIVAAPVKTLSGNDPDNTFTSPNDPEWKDGKGLSLSATPDLLARVNAMSDDDPNKAGIIAQLQRQQAADQKAADDAVAGQTRKPTEDEAMELALKRAKISDPAAYVAGRALVEDKYMTIPDSGALFDKSKGKVVYQNDSKSERQAAHDRAADERLDKRLDSQERIAQARMDALTKSKEVNEADVERNAQMIAQGRAPALSGYSMRSPMGAAIMGRVFEINPNFNSADFRVKQKAAEAFGAGKLGNSVRSFNVGISHLETLSQLVDALDNKDTQAINRIGNFFSGQTGSPAPTNFDAAKKIVADEIVKAIVGSGGGVTDREEAAKTLQRANSPAQLKGVIQTYKELMRGQLDGLRDQYKRTTGFDDFDEKFLSDAAKAVAHSEKPAMPSPIAPTTTSPAAKAPALPAGVKFLGFE